MHQVWIYDDARGVRQFGIMMGFSDYGGTDITYRFHRLGDDGKPITYDNGGICLDCVSGSRLKAAKRVGAVNPGEPFNIEA